ncbi:UDP-glucose 4-epimerase [Variovorax boronicumulans]|uniref:UDP-glucose 4-epimerase n=1 Tax=Variovorax boronicumulans TaxID=436515 RepID=A0AAW8CSI4_9BURK|nr:UDP-glucose 4-epimerase GalE [Variovorax boronicumulans]MDP9891209.1 UDP-glucose 4-epimerase [Variovorax boronicumulans]MDQ0051276.1 UDP-glucose 4-epimerase [Variovorax boronicumulans]
MSHPKILVTGGAGFIGSHVCVTLIEAGLRPVVLDTLVNSDPRSLQRVANITGVEPPLVRGDVRDAVALDRAFAEHGFDAVMHLAGLKAVGQSVSDSIGYYDVNVAGSLALIRAMERAGVRTLIFSSSATVYGDNQHSPIRESATYAAVNPYGRTKEMVERMAADLTRADQRWGIACLRFFNPIGAHESGLLGEHPHGPPDNLLPYVAQVAVGGRGHVVVHGNDYETPDGTGVRDYVHVMDVAEGHVAALRYAATHRGLLTVNLGTGRGASVLEVIAAFERAAGREIPVHIGPRRPGDAAAYWADVQHARDRLGWRARRNLDQMCADCWRWQLANPRGFDDPSPELTAKRLAAA